MSYDQNDMDKFFSALHEVPENVSIKKVHQLINHPPAQARLVETNSIKPFVIMSIATSVIIATTWILWPASEKNQSEPELGLIKKIPEVKVPTRKTEIVLESLPVVETTSDRIHSVNQKSEQQLTAPQTESIQEPDQNGNSTGNLSSYKWELTECGWPLDTIIPSENMILRLSLDEFLKLGFEYDESEKHKGLYYFNEYDGVTSAYYCDWKKRGSSTFRSASAPTRKKAERNKKTSTTHLDFYPLFITDFTGETRRGAVIRGFEELTKRDELIGVKLDVELSDLFDEDQVLWFMPSANFYEQLPSRYGDLTQTMRCIKEVRAQTGRTNVVGYQKLSILGSITPLRFPDEVLVQLGFTIFDHKIEYSQKETSMCGMTLSLGKSEIGVDMRGKHPERLSKLVFVSDSIGRQWISWTCPSGTISEKSTEAFVASYETLIPILLSKDQYEFLPEDQYMWFESTDELLSLIPGQQGEQIREEYAYLVTEDKSELSTACAFFEACRSTIHLHELDVYPNPITNGEVSLHFQLPDELDISISIADLNGREFSELVKKKTFDSGINDIKLNVAKFSPGIYLLIIRTKDGYLSRRLMIK